MHCQSLTEPNQRNTATPKPNSPKRGLALPKLHTSKHSKLNCAPAALWITSPLPCFAHKTKLNLWFTPQCLNSTQGYYALTMSDYAMRNLDGARPFFAFTRRYQQYRTMPVLCFAKPFSATTGLLEAYQCLHRALRNLANARPHDTLPTARRCITEPKPGFSVLCLCLALLCLAGAVKCFTLHNQYWTLPDPNGA